MIVNPSLCRLGLAIGLVLGLFPEVRAETFNIVTDGNCRTSTDGTHSHCQFPEIVVRDLEAQQLLIPYETVVQTRRSRTCQLDAVNAALQIRLGNRGAMESNFLRYEDFAIDHNRNRLLTHPRSHPLGSISIYPRVAQIFNSIVFPRGCQISLEVKLNRIALKSKLQAEEHVRSLTLELGNLTRSHAALVELRRQQQQMLADRGLIGRFLNLFNRGNGAAELDALRLHWYGLLNPLRNSLTALHQGPNRLEELDDLSELLTDFTNILDRTIAGAQLPAELNNLLGQAQREAANNPHAQANQLFEAEYLDQVVQRLRNAEGEIQVVRDYLGVLFPVGAISHALDEEFVDILHSEIVGPHGVIDEYLHKLSRIGRP